MKKMLKNSLALMTILCVTQYALAMNQNHTPSNQYKGITLGGLIPMPKPIVITIGGLIPIPKPIVVTIGGLQAVVSHYQPQASNYAAPIQPEANELKNDHQEHHKNHQTNGYEIDQKELNWKLGRWYAESFSKTGLLLKARDASFFPKY
ncbi:MAG: hypothetical protein NTX86_04490 [Candidatus Dependentiae bacterium]|nr:hypothetical protein [Candidatus Dependentiae bacterium]